VDLIFLPFVCLGLAILSFWVYRSPWLWGGFLALALILAIDKEVANPFVLIPIGTLFLIHLLLKKNFLGYERLLLIAVAIIISTCLSFHWIPGFHNWHVSGRFWINFDVPFIGFFILALQLPLIKSKGEWRKVALKAVPISMLGIGLMAMLAVYSGATTLQFKCPTHPFARILSNLFLVAIPEEAYFRGFIQEEIYKYCGKGAKGSILAVILTSLIFALYHLKWTSSLPLLVFTGLAGLLYGSIYQYTKAIESSIFCHISLNLIHMFFFSYHAI
jgi:hypothetical protein